MIPKIIFTFWEGEPMPDLVKNCLESQKKVKGYEHRIYNLSNCFKQANYIQEALSSVQKPAQQFCRIADYLRAYYLLEHGGIYLDADVEVLEGKNFDEMLTEKMFAGFEKTGWVGSAVIGAEPKHEFIKYWKEKMEKDFRGDDDKNIESTMSILTGEWNWKLGTVYPQEYFYPFCWQDNTTNITNNTVCIHKFLKSWV